MGWFIKTDFVLINIDDFNPLVKVEKPQLYPLFPKFNESLYNFIYKKSRVKISKTRITVPRPCSELSLRPHGTLRIFRPFGIPGHLRPVTPDE